MRWLHISDLHIGPNGLTADMEALMSRFLVDLKKNIDTEPVDCIVFTGDLFNRGAWTASQTMGVKTILKYIYKECSLAGNWGWTDAEPMTRLFYCPGNHDVLREAYCVSRNNHVLHRKNLVSTPANIISNGQLSTSGDNYSLLTQGTFGLFDVVMKELCGSDTYTSEYEYEYRIFQISDKDDDFVFIGINTALLAAQEFNPTDIANELKTALQDFFEQHSSLNTRKALDAYKKYDTAINKKLGTIKNDKNKLCFISAKAQEAIQAAQNKNTIPILFGHHPIQFLSEDAAAKAHLNMERNDISLYLCGHMHKPHGEIMSAPYEPYLGKLRDDLNIYQVAVGGLFPDQSGYNEMSYSIGELTHTQTDEMLLNISVFVLTKNVFNKFIWQTAEQSQTISINKCTQTAEGDSCQNGECVERDVAKELITDDHYVPVIDGNGKEKNEHSSTIQSDNDFRAQIRMNLNLYGFENKGG